MTDFVKGCRINNVWCHDLANCCMTTTKSCTFVGDRGATGLNRTSTVSNRGGIVRIRSSTVLNRSAAVMTRADTVGAS